MKTSRFLLYIAVAALAMSSCDKIDADENGNFITFSGVSGQWENCAAIADHTHRVMLEKYTGCHCPNCPRADVTINNEIEAFGDKLVVLAIHDGIDRFSEPFEGYTDLRSEVGKIWSQYFKIQPQGYPCALLSRQMENGATQYEFPADDLSTKIQTIINQEPLVALAVDCNRSGNAATITATVEYLDNVPEDLTLTLVVIEDGLHSAQQNGPNVDYEYTHNHVLRSAITDPWGVHVDANGIKGTCSQAKFVFKDIKSEWVADNCHVVAFISKKDTREILNVAECAL